MKQLFSTLIPLQLPEPLSDMAYTTNLKLFMFIKISVDSHPEGQWISSVFNQISKCIREAANRLLFCVERTAAGEKKEPASLYGGFVEASSVFDDDLESNILL